MRLSPEEASHFISSQHPDGLQLPRDFNLAYTSNHLESLVVYTALCDTDQDMRLLYGAFRGIAPGIIARISKTPKPRVRRNGFQHFDLAYKEAGAMNRPDLSFLARLQYILANTWTLDSTPKDVFAVDSYGDTECIQTIDGFPNHDEWLKTVERRVDTIDRHFHPID